MYPPPRSKEHIREILLSRGRDVSSLQNSLKLFICGLIKLRKFYYSILFIPTDAPITPTKIFLKIVCHFPENLNHVRGRPEQYRFFYPNTNTQYFQRGSNNTQYQYQSFEEALTIPNTNTNIHEGS